MRRNRNLPLDYSLCRMTVTVYAMADGSRRVLHDVHCEFTDIRKVEQGMARRSRSFLLVIPGFWDIQPGDKIVLGEGPEGLSWTQLNGAVPGLAVVGSVKPRYFEGKVCHMEVRG